MAGTARGQVAKPLEFSRKTMRLDLAHLDTIRIRNPNGATIPCDSIILLTEAEPRLGGLFVFLSRAPDSQPRTIGLYPRMRPGIETWDAGSNLYRSVFPYSVTELAFPPQKTLDFSWYVYDACPTCKRAAAEPITDSVVFRMIFKYGAFQDTLRMAMDKRALVTAIPTLRNGGGANLSGIGKETDLLGRARKPGGLSVRYRIPGKRPRGS